MYDLNALLLAVRDKGGSDLHLTVGVPPVVRLNGALLHFEGPVLAAADTRELVLGIMSEAQRSRLEMDSEFDFAHSIPGEARFRVNVYFQRNSIGAAFRLIPTEIRSIAELGLPSILNELADKRRGFVIITGPTGSGKSTTLAAMIDHINRTRTEHVITIEDPIEYLHSHDRCIINQREVGADTQSFAHALRHVLRQDPDVIPPHQQSQVRVQLAGALQGIVSQQLVPTSDSAGRAVAAEVLVPTPAVRNLIREGKSHQLTTAMQTGSQHGMVTMDTALADMYLRGEIAFDTAMQRAVDSNTLQTFIHSG